VAGLGIKAGYQHDMFAGLSDENVARVRRQNKRKISVIIGNPPYNANQANENDNNKNREYPRIDQLIKSSYIRLSTAQKTKVYDMYARFFRWASDRMADDGVLAFITNRSFIESRTFDGFRKAVALEFNEIYVVDLGGDVRANPKLSGTRNNVFGIQTGVAISFFVKRHKQKGCKIFYARRPEFDTADDKLAFLSNTPASAVSFQRVEPDKKGNWVNLTENDWDELVPVADKQTKAAKGKAQEKAIFRLYSQGLKTNRDEWVVDHDIKSVNDKVNFLVNHYNKSIVSYDFAKLSKSDAPDRVIKWTRKLNKAVRQRVPLKFEQAKIVNTIYRPFVLSNIYYDRHLNEDLYNLEDIFRPATPPNFWIGFLEGQRLDFMALAGKVIPNYALVSLDPIQVTPRHRYTKSGERVDNITDWALKEFQKAYGKDGRALEARPSGFARQDEECAHEVPPSVLPDISPSGGEIGKSRKPLALTKDDIFHYVYGALHDPVYREKYALNLKREFPRIPFYPDFWKWAEWGKRLMEVHIGYETVEPWPLERLDELDEKVRAAGIAPKAMLKADRDNGIIRLDTETQLSGIPKEAWDYRLGNRSGLDWVLDQYKEKTPKDPTIREKFNTYRFADYKDKVVDLLKRVTRVSVETVAITEAMKAARR
jgi:predicted helicase